MIFPPMMLRVKVEQSDRSVNLWLPLFLICPVVGILLLALVIILSPLLIIAAVILWRNFWFSTAVRSIPALMWCAAASRGLKVDVNGNDQRVFISLF